MRADVLALGLVLVAAVSPGRSALADSGLPVPRFVTLRAQEANIRTGPGIDYPIDWVFVRSDLPLEIVAEYDTWRKVRDWEGVEGWIHQSLLSGQRGVVVLGDGDQPVYAEPRADARIVAEAEPGVIGDLLRCPDAGEADSAWCYVDVGGYRGWMARASFWGAYPSEKVD